MPNQPPQFIITSMGNPLVKRVRGLEQRKGRREAGAFFVEGIRAVWLAVERGAEVEVIIVAPDLLTSAPALQMVAQYAAGGGRVVFVSSAVFAAMAERDNPSGLAAIVGISLQTLADLKVTDTALFVALHSVGNPGNLGTIIRTVDAVGGAGVILIGHATDPYHPTAVKASMGTIFSVPIVNVDSVADLLGWCKVNRISIYPTSDRAAAVYWTVRYQLPALLLFGSEGEGLDANLLQQGEAVSIPMSGALTGYFIRRKPPSPNPVYSSVNAAEPGDDG